MYDKFKNYILETDFKVIYINNKIDIVNYTEIGHFDSNKIIVKNDKKLIIVKGENLVISKLLKDELLIEGKIKGVQFE